MQFGKYSITCQLDEADDCDRYLATVSEPSGTRHCVIKQIPDFDMGPTELRFLLEKEARVAAGLNHPNIVRIYEYGEVSGLYFVALEYVEGRTLEEVMATLSGEQLRLNLPTVLALGLAISDALIYLHEGVVLGTQRLPLLYRQLCPANIQLSSQGAIKLADFPFYRPSDADLRRAAKTSLGYLAPERVMGLEFDGRADIFSLGVILGELLLGKPVFRKSNSKDTFTAILGEVLPTMSSVRPDLPTKVDEVLHHALARRRDVRYATARSFYNDLLAIASQVDMSSAAYELSALARNQVPSRHAGMLVSHTGVRSLPQTSAVRAIEFPEVNSTGEGNALVVWIALATATAVAGAVFFVLRMGV